MLKGIFKENYRSVLIVIGIIILLVVISVPSKDNKKTNNMVIDSDVKELFNKITNNYTLKIDISNNIEGKTYNYASDGNITLVDFGDKDYLIYKDNTYLMNTDNYKLTNVNYELDSYLDMEFIKKIVNLCEFENIDDSNEKCILKVNDYIKEYNEYYKKEYSSNDENIEIIVKFFPSKIHSFDIDYTNINKIINNEENVLKYKYTFKNNNSNDFNEIKEYYKNILK